MKFLFLDCDGVLNCAASFTPTILPSGEKVHAYDPIDPDKMERLNRIVSETNCLIVISSAWRAKYSLDQLRSHFVKNGFAHNTNVIVDVTPRNHERIRGEEIADWLSNWSLSTTEQLTGICVLDDSELFPDYVDTEHEVSARWLSFVSLVKNNFVQTLWILGLQDHEANACIRRLNTI